jgi:hypothetical protein
MALPDASLAVRVRVRVDPSVIVELGMPVMLEVKELKLIPLIVKAEVAATAVPP